MSGPDGPYLCPPDTGKNFLISPPGSPPIGWEQVVEDPPNATPLAEDLISALKKLQLLDRTKPSGVVGPEILLESEEAGGISVYVEDCDGGEDGRGEDGGREEQWVYGVTMASQMRFKPTATSRPPAMEEGVVA
jgi:calcipressin-2